MGGELNQLLEKDAIIVPELAQDSWLGFGENAGLSQFTFMFAQAESLWTMARYGVPVIVVIFNNRSYNGPRNKILRAGGRQAQTR